MELQTPDQQLHSLFATNVMKLNEHVAVIFKKNLNQIFNMLVLNAVWA